MATCAHGGQAVGIAAALCISENLLPRDLREENRIRNLQKELLKTGQHIPHHALKDEQDLVQRATVKASSELNTCKNYPKQASPCRWNTPWPRCCRLPAGKMPTLVIHPYADESTELEVELRICSRKDSHHPM